MIRKVNLALLICLILIGCKSSPVAGTWVTTTTTYGFNAITFTNDGTFEATAPKATSPVFSGTWEIQNGQVNLSVDHSNGHELSEDSLQAFTGSISKDGKQLAIGSAVFTKH
jgi:hypothetical protein